MKSILKRNRILAVIALILVGCVFCIRNFFKH